MFSPMPFTPKRSICSYAKVQRLVGHAIRNKRFQLRGKHILCKHYLDVGCGWKTHDHMINLDWQWHPTIDLCWDIATLGLPFPDQSLKGIYSEHCLEHHPPETILFLLSESLRILKPGGVIRLVLPDAEKYLIPYSDMTNGLSDRSFPYPQDITWKGISSPLLGVNRIFYQDRESANGHCFMFDQNLLGAFLVSAGFVNVSYCGFRSGADANLLLDSEDRWVESFAMEAQRPSP
jgi:predicted SAM-dependent methyltransferase